MEVGGCLTGEHGVGLEKRDLMGVQFSEPELDRQRALKAAFDPGLAAEPGQGVPAEGGLSGLTNALAGGMPCSLSLRGPG